MPLVELRGECSDLLHLQIETWRGPIPRDQFLLQALAIGLGHIQEEVVQQARQTGYDALAINTTGYSVAKEHQKIQPASSRASVTPLGADLTKRAAS